MDPDVARMLADLGNSRRDELSAPDEGRKDRFPSRSQREERMILLEAEDRRAKAHLNAKDEGEAATLKAWNTASTFGIDDVAEQMENRYSGQGHRARLRQEVSQNFGYEADNGPRFSHRSRQDYAQDEENRRMHHQNYQTRANAPGLPCQRAPSPRSFGKVKFVGNQRLPQQPGVLAAASSIPTDNFTFTASTSASSTSSVATATDIQARPVAPVAQPPAQAQPPPKKTPAPAPASEMIPQPKAALEPPTVPSASVPAARTRAVGTSTAMQATSGTRSSALSAATASPPEPPPAKAKSISREGILGSIYKHLMKNKDASLPKPASQEKAGEEDIPAPKAVERGVDLAETSETTIPLPTKLPVEEWMSSSMGPQFVKKMQALNDAAQKEDLIAHWEKTNEAHFLHTAREKIAEDVALLAQPEHSKQADEYYAHQRYRAWLRPYGAQARIGPVQNTDIPVIAEIVKATNNLLGKDAAAAAAPQQSVANPRSTSARPPTPPSTASNSRSSSVGARNSTDLSSPPQPETAAGALGATFYNKNGVLLGNRQYSVDAPVIASITLTAKDSTYDVLGLADNMDSLAYQMGLRKATRAKYGYHLSDSGKYFD
ncbi:hypothetical protein HII31_11901 [Pseudocercospora fuligena]|uniref:Uncharacterized protein n=1 Tax=Pseudocercospora fuligena TaxID=685502 RepID=A0A8H6R7R8_9PEZI|nr:hypothetical protein HII31_11901 [Pseudocercospora fuligena]